MADLRKMNVLVMGASGAGKSTLIDAIAGTQVCDGLTGEATEVIDMFESSTWPLRIIDTKGIDSHIFDKIKAVWHINKYLRKASSDDTSGDDGAGIDAVWYCVDGSADKLDTGSIDTMNYAIKNLRNVPVFVALTKAVSDEKVEKLTAELMTIFAKCKNFNLKGMIPIVAKTFESKGQLEATPKGVEDLCTTTVDCYDTAHVISRENRENMRFEQRRYTANGLVAAAAAAAIIVGALPTLPIADSAILVPLETGMTKGILKTYSVSTAGDLIGSIVGSTAITKVAKAAVSSLKAVPNVAGSVINAAVAGIFVTAIGEAVIALSEAISTGKIDKAQIDLVSNFIGGKLTENKTVGSSVRFINENAGMFKDKSAKQIFNMIIDAVKGKPSGPDLAAPGKKLNVKQAAERMAGAAKKAAEEQNKSRVPTAVQAAKESAASQEKKAEQTAKKTPAKPSAVKQAAVKAAAQAAEAKAAAEKKQEQQNGAPDAKPGGDGDK